MKIFTINFSGYKYLWRNNFSMLGTNSINLLPIFFFFFLFQKKVDRRRLISSFEGEERKNRTKEYEAIKRWFPRDDECKFQCLTCEIHSASSRVYRCARTIRERSSLDFKGNRCVNFASCIALDLICIERVYATLWRRDREIVQNRILLFHFLPPFQPALSKYYFFRGNADRYTCFPDVTNADCRVRFTTSLLRAVTFTYIDRCVYAGRG